MEEGIDERVQEGIEERVQEEGVDVGTVGTSGYSKGGCGRRGKEGIRFLFAPSVCVSVQEFNFQFLTRTLRALNMLRGRKESLILCPNNNK